MSVVPGYVRCRITGGEFIRFMNLCRNNGIEMKHIVTEDNGFQMNIRAEDFKRLGPAIRKTHVKLHILNRRGPAFFFYSHRYRRWFLLGLALCAAIIWYLSLFIWQIDINGNQKYTDELILQSLREMNVTTGCRKSQLSLPDIEEELRIMYNEITWVSASVTGTRLQIELREGKNLSGSGEENAQTDGSSDITISESTEAEGIDNEASTNLVAITDAVITSIVVRSGTASVKAGDRISCGDVLVEGKVYIYNDDETLRQTDEIQADADIYGDYEEYYQLDYPRSYTVRIYTGENHTACAVNLGGYRLPLPDFYTQPEVCEQWTWQKYYRLTNTFYLPVFLDFTEYIPYELQEASHTDEELYAMAEADLEKYLEDLEKKGVQIIENSVTILLGTEACRASGVLSLNGPVAESAAAVNTEENE